MDITILGSGTSLPHASRSSSSIWIDARGGRLMLDCPPSVVTRVGEENLPWGELDAIWISHFHLDHCGGIAPLLFGMKNADETRARHKPLRIFGPKGIRKLIDSFDRAGNYGLLKQRFPVEVLEVSELEEFSPLAGLSAFALKTPHTSESHAIRLNAEGEKALVFTSDTGPFPAIATFAAAVDLLIIEASFVHEKPVEKHLTLAEAMHIIRKAGPKSAILTHLYPEWDDVDVERELLEFSPPCDVRLAADGLRVSI